MMYIIERAAVYHQPGNFVASGYFSVSGGLK